MRDRPFTCAWLFLAGLLGATCVAARETARWEETLRLHLAVAAGLLVAGAVFHAGAARLLDRELRRTIEIPLALIAALTLCGSWAAFWIADLHRARFQLVLVLLPVFAALFPVARSLRFRVEPPVWLFSGISAVIASGRLGPVYGLLQGVPARYLATDVSVLAVTGAVFVLGARRVARPWLGDAGSPSSIAWPRVISAGIILGVAPLWTLLLRRYHSACGCSCGGVSEAYEATLVVTTLAVFGATPFAVGALLEDD